MSVQVLDGRSKIFRSVQQCLRVPLLFFIFMHCSFTIAFQATGPENLFCNYLTRIHREEVGESFINLCSVS